MSTNDQAFPGIVSGSAHAGRISGSYDLRFESIGGMSLRDYFAAQAMNGMLRTAPDITPSEYASIYQLIAELSYQCADAMLAERGRPAAPPETEQASWPEQP